MDHRSAGTLIIAVGVAAIVLGALVATGALSWFGRLPGDVRFARGGTRVFIPITSMLIVSVVLTLIMSLLRR